MISNRLVGEQMSFFGRSLSSFSWDVQSMLWLYDIARSATVPRRRTPSRRGRPCVSAGHRRHGATLFMRHSRTAEPVTAKTTGRTKVADISASARSRLVNPPLHLSRTTRCEVRRHGVNRGFTALTPGQSVRPLRRSDKKCLMSRCR